MRSVKHGLVVGLLILALEIGWSYAFGVPFEASTVWFAASFSAIGHWKGAQDAKPLDPTS